MDPIVFATTRASPGACSLVLINAQQRKYLFYAIYLFIPLMISNVLDKLTVMIAHVKLWWIRCRLFRRESPPNCTIPIG